MSLAILQIDTERGWRGGERQTLLFARELARRGHRVSVACRPGEPLAQRAGNAGLRVIPVQPRSEIALASAFALRALIRREGIQIVHAHAAHAVALAVLATVGTRARVVVTRHLAIPLRDNPGTRWKYRRAAAIIAVSHAAADALAASGIPRDQVEVVHEGVELERAVTPASPELLRRLGIREDGPLVVMVGALVPQKDPLTFVRAIAVARQRLPALQALILGEGELRRAVEQEVREAGLAGALHLPGFRDDVDAILCAADAAVLSSRFEGLPLTIMDAFVLGVPVAATAGEGIPELVQHGVTGLLVPVSDHVSLGHAIADILLERPLAERLARGGRARAAELSIEDTVSRTLRVYQRVLGDGSEWSGEETSRRTEAAMSASSDSATRAP